MSVFFDWPRVEPALQKLLDDLRLDRTDAIPYRIEFGYLLLCAACRLPLGENGCLRGRCGRSSLGPLAHPPRLDEGWNEQEPYDHNLGGPA